MRTPLPLSYPLLLAIALLSCDKSEDEIADTAPPSVTVTSKLGKSVSGTARITASLEDLSDDVHVAIYVDGIVVKEGPATSVEFDLDTHTLTDGAHMIKIVATDPDGNASTTEIPVTVRNTLIKIDVSANYVESNSKVYFFISRNDGSLIAEHEAHNGVPIIVPTPDNFNPDSTFVVTEFLHSEYTGFVININVANVYAGVRAGQFRLPDVAAARVSVGMHSFEMNDLPEGHQELQGTNLTSNYGSGNAGTRTIDLGMFSQTSDMYFYADHGNGTRPVFKYLPVIEAGGTTKFSVNGLSLMNDHSMSLREPADEYSVRITGYRDALKDGVQVYNDNLVVNTSALPAFFPAATFPNYYTSIYIYASGIQYNYNSKGAIPPSTFKYIDANVNTTSYAAKTFALKATGNFDFALTSDIKQVSGPSSLDIFGWYITFPAGMSRVRIPELPQHIFDLGLPPAEEAAFAGAALYDIDEVVSTDDYSSKVVFSSDGLYRNMRPQVGIAKFPDQNTGGRVTSTRITLPQQLGPVLERHLPLR